MGDELSPADLDAFRSRMNGQTADDYVRGPSAPAPPPTDMVPNTGTAPARDNTGFQNALTSIQRLSENPTVKGLGASVNPLGSLASYGTSRLLGGPGAVRDTTSFQRELEDQPQHVDLKPMTGPELTMPNTPTLAQQRSPAAHAGGFGGGGVNPMTGLAASYKQAQLNQFGTLDEQRDLVERRGELQGERVDANAHLQELDAARKTRDAEVMAQHQAQVQARHEAFLARNQELADQIGAEKIDPSHVIADKSLGEKLALTLAGALSGAIGQGPQFMARMDGIVDQAVKAQMANADNLKARLGARQNLFGQMMAESGDRRTAELQTKQLVWEAAKQKMAADAERLGIPEIQNNAQLMQNQIVDQRINPLRVQMTGQALQAAQAQANAAAAAQRAAEDRAFSRGIEVSKLGLEKDKQDLERQKFEAENGGEGGVGKAGRQAMALDQAKAQRELDGNLAGVTAAQKDIKAIAAGGSLGNAVAGLPAWVPGATSAKKDVNAREAYNALVRPGVGAAWKLRTGGVEPKNPTILDEQSKAFMVQPSDSEEVVQDRMDRFRKHMNESAAAAGAVPAALPPGLKFDK